MDNLFINHYHVETVDHDCEQITTLITDSSCSLRHMYSQILQEIWYKAETIVMCVVLGVINDNILLVLRLCDPDVNADEIDVNSILYRGISGHAE